jgi:hypothetical protein
MLGMIINRVFIVLIANLLILQPAFSLCHAKGSGLEMCKGNGFCTYFPIGKKGEACGNKWTIPKNWVAMDLDCLSNVKKEQTLSCENGGIVDVIICGKSNCYRCNCQ